MKGIYWRPKGISSRALLLISLLAAGSAFVVEKFQKERRQPHLVEKREAADLANRAMLAIKEHRLQTGFVVDPLTDPANSAILGSTETPVTTNKGGFYAKRTSINPNFAAVIVEMMKEAGIKEGDTIAVGVSGSFPAINMCVYAAAKTLKLNPIIICSASSSEWGANDPDLLWIDMERILNQKKIFEYRAIAASLGGIDDKAKGLPVKSRDMLREAVRRNGLELIDPQSYAESVSKRLALYTEHAGERPIRLYVNVGGGTSSAGKKLAKDNFKQGLNLEAPRMSDPETSVMASFAKSDVPVIHMLHIQDVARDYFLPDFPNYMPLPGEGGVFLRTSYNRILTAILLVAIIGALYAFIHSQWGAQFLRPANIQKGGADFEPMV